MGCYCALNQRVGQDQRLIVNMAMLRAFNVLQMPITALGEWLEREIEHNPILEISKPRYQHLADFEIPVVDHPSPYAYLLKEIHSHFYTEKECKIAEYVAGSLDEKGFLTLSDEELCATLDIEQALLSRVLHTFQRMRPLGLGAHNVQEALLIQLEAGGLKGTTIYHIVKQFYNDLLHHRFKNIMKAFRLNITELKSTIYSQLHPLTPFPGHSLISRHSPTIIPDITVERGEGMWQIEINRWGLPPIQIHAHYLEMAENGSLDRKDAKYIHRHIAASKWLKHIVRQREKALEKIMAYILEKQVSFLEGVTQTPLPMTMSEIASALNRSESTITRAVSNKFISCPLGVLELRSFFTQALQADEGIISNRRAKDLLLKLIEQEETPLSDDTLSKLLKDQGISCARRTVTKYRQQLKILSASKRGMWKRYLRT